MSILYGGLQAAVRELHHVDLFVPDPGLLSNETDRYFEVFKSGSLGAPLERMDQSRRE
jgi:hypothetical protein